MKQFARIEDGYVVELLCAVELPPFHESLIWVECEPVVQVGWRQVGDDLVPPAATVISPAERIAAERVWRDGAIGSIKWLRERHRDEIDLDRDTTLNAEQFKQLLGYLQALRDWPLADGFPAQESRPAAPPWVAEQAE